MATAHGSLCPARSWIACPFQTGKPARNLLPLVWAYVVRLAARTRSKPTYQGAHRVATGTSYQVTEVQKYLKGAQYPMDGGQLTELAKRNGGPDELVRVLGKIDRADGPSGVMQRISDHLGGSTG